jgi:hypothetical protein
LLEDHRKNEIEKKKRDKEERHYRNGEFGGWKF